ncbi:MAG: DUF1476 domain-containing protein [Holosporaceae bacterium]|nr:DUF1476 domain-containing protein [Holosporaceae bacterium]
MFSFDKSSCEKKLLDVLQSRFFITARRNKILAKWAGGRLGYVDDVLSKYIKNMVFSYLIKPNDKKMIDRILLDFKDARINMSEEAIRQKIKAIEERIQVRSEAKYVD